MAIEQISSGFLSAVKVLPWAVIGAAVGWWIKTRPQTMQIKQQGDQSLREDLMQRIVSLETQVAEVTRKAEEQRLAHERELALMRHRLNNETMCLDALLLMLETSPEKVADGVAKIKEMRQQQKMEIAAERGAVRGVAAP